MKKTRRFKLLLTPILISVLSLIMIVTSFAWYQAASGEMKTGGDGSVDITTNKPKGLDVQITSLGDKCEAKYGTDNYYYDSVEKTYTITKDNTVGFFGQTGLGDITVNNNDKPYIRFYKADISCYDTKGIEVTKAFVDYAKITKGNEVLLDVSPNWTEQTSEFSVDFYTCTQRTIEGNKTELVFSKPTETFITLDSNNIVNEMTVYFGLKFFKRGSTKEFAYIDFLKYFKSTFSLRIKFI